MRAAGMLLMLACGALAAPVPPFRGAYLWEHRWDRPTDPAGGCTFTAGKDELAITLPDAARGGSRAREEQNAPRLLRSVKGDFVAELRVELEGRPSALSVAGAHEGEVTGGVVLSSGDRLAVFHVERISSGHTQGGMIVRAAGKRSSAGISGLRVPSGDVGFVRMERFGNYLRASFSVDGKEWVESCVFGTRLPDEVKVGVLASSTSRDASRVRFRDFKLGPIPLGTKRPVACPLIGGD